MPRHTPAQRVRQRERRRIKVINALKHEGTRTSPDDAERRVRVGIARWVVPGAAIELIVRTEKRVAKPGDLYDAAHGGMARDYAIAHIPIVQVSKLLARGSRSAGPLHMRDGIGPSVF